VLFKVGAARKIAELVTDRSDVHRATATYSSILISKPLSICLRWNRSVAHRERDLTRHKGLGPAPTAEFLVLKRRIIAILLGQRSLYARGPKQVWAAVAGETKQGRNAGAFA
jgi:hypothetical protein